MTKALILAAGMGSRIGPLTSDCPKTLLEVGGITILERMLDNILACGIDEFVVVLGFLHERIRQFVDDTFPDLDVQFVVNDRYRETNTGYSLMLATELLEGSPFVKFDGDVVFEKAILQQLLASSDENCLCIDRNIQLDAEEVKVILADGTRVLRASKSVAPEDAIGESIGIEKIGASSAKVLATELRLMMQDVDNFQEYYEGAYERLIENDTNFHAVDITGLDWCEIDTLRDLETAGKLFK
jgi:choline kinase